MSDLLPETWTHTGFAQRLHFGAGAVGELPDIAKSLGVRRALLVTTARGGQSDDGLRIVKLLGRTVASTFAEARSHVPTTTVQAAVQQARRDAVDGVVSFGGGSCADLGKAISFFVEQEAGTPGASYADRPALRHIAIPTTYSGRRAHAVLRDDRRADSDEGRSGGGPTSAPIAVVYDPLLTLSTPARVSAETGMNALAHCVEAAYSPRPHAGGGGDRVRWRAPAGERAACGGRRSR